MIENTVSVNKIRKRGNYTKVIGLEEVRGSAT